MKKPLRHGICTVFYLTMWFESSIKFVGNGFIDSLFSGFRVDVF